MMKCEGVILELWYPSGGEGSRAKNGLSLVKISVSSEPALGPPIQASYKKATHVPEV